MQRWIVVEVSFAFFFIQDQCEYILKHGIFPFQIKYIRKPTKEIINIITKEDPAYLDLFPFWWIDVVGGFIDEDGAVEFMRRGAFLNKYKKFDWYDNAKSIYELERM